MVPAAPSASLSSHSTLRQEEGATAHAPINPDDKQSSLRPLETSQENNQLAEPHKVNVQTLLSSRRTSNSQMADLAEGRCVDSYEVVLPAVKEDRQERICASIVETRPSYEYANSQPEVKSRGENVISSLNADSPVSAFGAEAYHSETRKISSVVIESTLLGQETDTKDRVRYVEVPTIEEQVKYVTVYEKRVVQREEPEYYTEWVDKFVHVPKTEYVDIPNPEKRVVERLVEVKKPHIVERTREVPVEHKVYKSRQVQCPREVPGEFVDEINYVERRIQVDVPRFVDKETPVVVAQTIKPIITESGRSLAVDVLDYEPEVTTINVHIAKPVASALEVVGQREVRHKLVNITSGQYNTILRQLNSHLDEKAKQSLPYVADGGRVAFVSEQEAHFIVAPSDVKVEGWNRAPAQQHMMNTEIKSRQIAPSLQSRTFLESQHESQYANRTACCNTRVTKKANPAPSTQTHAHMEKGARLVEVTTRAVSASVFDEQGAQNSTFVQQPQQYAPGGGVYVSQRDVVSNSKSQQRSNMQTEQSGVYTENVGAGEEHGSTVLSQRPQQRSRVCC